MSDVETVERIIAAPPEQIFALLADPAKHREIDGSGTVRGATAAPGRLTLGSTFGMKMRLGVSYSMQNTVIEFEENRRIAWQTRPTLPLVDKMVGGRIWRYELEPVDGGTRVRETWDISEEIVKAFVRPAAGTTRKSMQATLERIDQLLSA